MDMNNERRKTLDGAIEEVRQAKTLLEAMSYKEVTDLLESAKSAVDEVKDAEQEAFDNMSENLQGGEKGQRMEEVTSELDEASSDLSDLISSIEQLDLSSSTDDIIGRIEGCKD
jgi:hypothetical protein